MRRHFPCGARPRLRVARSHWFPPIINRLIGFIHPTPLPCPGTDFPAREFTTVYPENEERKIWNRRAEREGGQEGGREGDGGRWRPGEWMNVTNPYDFVNWLFISGALIARSAPMDHMADGLFWLRWFVWFLFALISMTWRLLRWLTLFRPSFNGRLWQVESVAALPNICMGNSSVSVLAGWIWLRVAIISFIDRANIVCTR